MRTVVSRTYLPGDQVVYATFVAISILCALSLALLYRGVKTAVEWVIGLSGKNESFIDGKAELRKPWGW